MFLMSPLFCPDCPAAFFFLSGSIFFCPGYPVSAVLSFSLPTCPPFLLRLTCPGCHVPAILSQLSLASWLVPAVLSWLSYHFCWVQAPRSMLSCFGGPVLSFVSWLSCPNHPLLLSCTGCPVHALASPCPVLAVRFWPSYSICPVQDALSWLFRTMEAGIAMSS